MSTTTRTAIAALVLALALTGCSAAGDTSEPEAEPRSSVQQSTPEESAEARPAAPVDCDPARSYLDPDGDIHDEVDPDNLDCSYLESVRRVIAGHDTTTDAQLIEWGHGACDQYDAGATWDTISIPEAATAEEQTERWNSGAIATASAFVYCDEHYSPAV